MTQLGSWNDAYEFGRARGLDDREAESYADSLFDNAWREIAEAADAADEGAAIVADVDAAGATILTFPPARAEA